MTEERKVTVQKLEQTDLWSLRDKYGQHTYCFDCLQPLAVGDTIVKILVHTWQRPRLYHSRCFNGAKARDPVDGNQK